MTRDADPDDVTPDDRDAGLRSRRRLDDDPSVVEAFVGRDPYVANGVVTRWRIRPWTVVVGALVPAEP